MFNTIEVAKKIRSARQARNMTQMALADAMGVSFQAVSNWERGNSLPDIGKLPDLCRILDLDIQTLLGEDQKETKTIEKLMKEEAVPLRDLAEVAPMLPPQQVESSFRREEKETGSVDTQALLALAPFLDDEYLRELVQRMEVDKLGDVIALAPFLPEDALDDLALRFEGSAENSQLIALAPFLSERALDQLAEKLPDTSFANLTALAPFLSEESLDKLTDRLLEKEDGSWRELVSLAPFLGDQSLRKAVEKALKSGQHEVLHDLGKFL